MPGADDAPRPILDEHGRAALQALDLGEVLFDAPVPGAALDLGGRAAAVVVAPSKAGFSKLRGWCRRARVPLRDLRDRDGLWLVPRAGIDAIVVAPDAEIGSTLRLFEDPPKGETAAELVEGTGLAGIRVRGARLLADPPGHAAPDADGADAEDFQLLADYVRDRVRTTRGVTLRRAFMVLQ